MLEVWLPLAFEGLYPLLGVPVLQVVRHHHAALLVRRLEGQLQLVVVEPDQERILGCEVEVNS